LILVDKITLLKQWKDRLSEFLDINEILPEEPKKKGTQEEKKHYWTNRCGQRYIKRHYRYCCYAIA